jgi:RNA polymerase sigma-70 factor, ECF subfamily
LTRQRRSKARPETFLDEEKNEEEKYFVAPVRESPSKQFEQGEKQNKVRQALNSLPPDLRQVIVMKEFEEMTFQEISDALDVPLSTVKSRVYTALKQMRMKLERIPLEII